MHSVLKNGKKLHGLGEHEKIGREGAYFTRGGVFEACGGNETTASGLFVKK